MIGAALVQALRWRGDEVVRLTRRRPISPDERQWFPSEARIGGPGLADVDAVVNLAGEPIASGRWTEKRKQEILTSRVNATRACVSALTADGRCQRFLNGSAIGVYGKTGDEAVTELSPHGEGFLAEVVVAWEQQTRDSPVPAVLLRSGHVLSPRGGYIGRQLPLFQMGLGGKWGDGSQWLSWISLDDEIRAIVHLLSSSVTGPVNLTAPEPVTNERFTAALAHAIRRVAAIPVPVPAVRALYGNELVDEGILASQRVLPGVLLEDDFRFLDMQIEPALARLLANS